MVRPCLRTRKPTPPPSVIPPTPTEPVSPNGTARSWAASAVGDLAGGQAGLRPREALLGVDGQVLHVGEVEDNPAVGGAVPGAAVPPAAHRQLHPGLAREVDDAGNLAGVASPDDHGGTQVVPAVEHLAGLVIVGVVGGDHAATHVGSQPRGQNVGGWPGLRQGRVVHRLVPLLRSCWQCRPTLGSDLIGAPHHPKVGSPGQHAVGPRAPVRGRPPEGRARRAGRR